MIGARKDGDLVPAGDRPADAGRGQDGLRTRVGEGHARHAGHFAYQGGHFAGQKLEGADFEAAIQLFVDRLDDEGRPVPEHAGAEAHHEIDVFVAVDVPNLRSI